MTREQDFERDLADWLGDGPRNATKRAIDMAVAHARAHPRRERGLGGLWSALNVNLAPVTPGAHRTSLAFAAMALVIVSGLAGAVGGTLLANRGQGNPVAAGPSPATVAAPSATAAASAASAPTALPTAVAPTPTPTPITMAPLHVTGTQSPLAPWPCGTYCPFSATVHSSDSRLAGCYIMTPAGSTTAGTWGTIAFYQEDPCNSSQGISPHTMTWQGEWFTSGPRPVRPDGFNQAGVYPVDTIWLHGVSSFDSNYEGLSAVLRMTDNTHVDGWIYTTPTP